MRFNVRHWLNLILPLIVFVSYIGCFLFLSSRDPWKIEQERYMYSLCNILIKRNIRV